MISIIKSGSGPASLADGIALTAADCARYDANSKPYRKGRAKFAFSSGVYGSSKVKNALKRIQHNKCCYCEAIFEANYAGDVDHYRPKGAIGSGKNRIRPGYYWLAYLWNNLYYACADCDQYRKRAAFPLVDERRRALDHHANLALENPLILDPGGATNPRDHVKFKLDVPMGISDAGRTTVDQIKHKNQPPAKEHVPGNLGKMRCVSPHVRFGSKLRPRVLCGSSPFIPQFRA
jgi:uncharacterized protein (TIGR02646 family)